MRAKTYLPILLFALALTCAVLGCALPTQPMIVVTATPIPVTPSITPIPSSPTPVPTATIAPTPTTAPNVALSQADSSLRNGDYDAAVAVYQSILGRPLLSVDPKLRANASLGMGTAALREGKFADAVTALSDFMQTYRDDIRLPQAYFLRGDAYMGLSQWANAIADFLVYVQKRPGVIDSYAFERIGDSYLALGNSAQALTNYALAVNAGRGLQPMLTLREKVAATYLNVNDVKDALAQYDANIATAKDAVYKSGMALTAANLQLRSGNSADAYRRYQQILSSYPESQAAYGAMQALLKAGTPVDNLLRGKISFNAQDYNDAITALYAYTGQTQIGQIDPQVFMLLGQAYREVGNMAAANTSFQAVIDQFPTSPQFGDAWLEQGRTLLLSNKVDQAIAKYKELSDKHPAVPQGAEALWRAGYLYSTSGNTDASLATFESLGNKYPGTDWAMDGLFRGGMAAYNQAANGRAERLFNLLATTGTGSLKAAGFLWLGRLYQVDNKLDLARQSYNEAAKADPGGYYSFRAADLLAGHGPFVPPTGLDLAFNDGQHISEAEDWLRSKFKITQSGDLWPLSQTLQTDTRMIRGSELWAVAAYDDAKGEFEALTADNEKNTLAMYQLASYYYRIGLYVESINTTAKMLDDVNVETIDAPKAIAAMRFPIAYYDLVLPAAQKFSVDPLLVFSVIRQESLFQGVATSYASAQGLMQIIPDTGNYIASKLNWSNYQNSDLYKPYINVTFGVFYLQEQLDTFNKNVYAALAAYNAGPGPVGDWLRIANGDPDLFIEAIDLDQTKTYVRRIYEQYETYARIYAAK